MTTRFNVKALRAFSVLLSFKFRSAKDAFGQFNGPDLLMIGRSRSYRDIANQDFASSDVEVFLLLDSPIFDFPMAVSCRDFSRLLRSATRVLTDGQLIFAPGISLERNPITCSQDSRFVESRYVDGPFLFGTFPESSDLRHTSPQDGQS